LGRQETTVTYAHVVDVAAPIEMYDALHAEILQHGGETADGLLVHVGRPTTTGFQVLEIWESRSHFDRYNDQIVLPTLERVTAGRPEPTPQQTIQEFDVHGLVLTGGKQAI
jgi:hypothetical protein